MSRRSSTSRWQPTTGNWTSCLGGTLPTATLMLTSCTSSSGRDLGGLDARDHQHYAHYCLPFLWCFHLIHFLFHAHSGQRLKLGPSEGALVPDPTSQNPFAQRPSSTVGGARGEDPMVELDHVSHMPEGIDASTWERFIAARRKKVESEQKVCV